MSSLLIKNIAYLVSMDEQRRTWRGGAILIHDQRIAAIGGAELAAQHAERTIDGSRLLIMPGLINTHHHLYQTLTRALPAAQNAKLFDWLRVLYPIWGQLTDEAVYVSTLVGLAELALSGCTTTTDHLYIYPNDASLDASIRAARELGVRFQPCRGSMSLGESEGGLPPDMVVEDEDDILADTERLIALYHDPAPCAMTRIVIAPCSPFSVTASLMRRSAELARKHGALLHTHLAETRDEESFCREQFGRSPLEYAEELGWTGEDVWYAHGIHFSQADVQRLAQTKTGVAHCPGSNMRLGSGIAPISEMRRAGVRVGLAVDGSASNDASHLLAEARLAMLLQRVTKGADALSAQDVLEMATLGGASILQRNDIGALIPGKAADLIGIDLNRLEYAGGWADPLGALVFCAPVNVTLSVINGRIVVEDGRLQGVDLEQTLRKHREISEHMIEKAQGI
jgi:cytosine/adenosine deaminase-related metal-dependent hydrolase